MRETKTVFYHSSFDYLSELPKNFRHLVFGGKFMGLFALILSLPLISAPARAEVLPSNMGADQARNMSSALKTFICTDERHTPGWCEEFKRSKFRKLAKAQPAVRGAVQTDHLTTDRAVPDVQIAQTSSEQGLLTEEEKATIAERKAREAAEAARKAAVVQKWKDFLSSANPARLTSADVEILNEYGAMETYPEANEILGYAYSVGSGVIQENQMDAYRQYGKAFLKGLKRVKRNMNVIWRKLKQEERQIILKEFEEAKKAEDS